MLFSGFSRPSSLLMRKIALLDILRREDNQRWTPELASLGREVRRFFNRCRADSNSASGNSTERLNGCIGGRYVGLPKRPGGPSVAPSMTYLGRLGYIGPYLRTLKPSWDPWWLLPESARNPRGNIGSLTCYSLPRIGCCRRGCGTAADHRATRVDWRVAARIITYRRVGWAIDPFAPYKSPGMDGIFPALLQEGRGPHSIPGQDPSCLPGDWVCSSFVAPGQGNVYT